MMVTITVTDVDEAPVTPGTDARIMPENGTAAGPPTRRQTLRVRRGPGPWRVTTLATSTSAVTDGVLTFGSPPDYENRPDADPDNVYKVTVKASDGTNEDTLDVTVTVTDVDEDVAPADPLITARI